MAGMEYLDFDLEVEATATPGVYQVSVLSSPQGEASALMTFPFGSLELENVILKLGRTRSGVRAVGSPTETQAKDFGARLYDALFGGEVGTCFRRSLDAADAKNAGLRVRLRLGRAPQLSDVPWEYLYTTSLRQFLVLSTRTPVVRYLEQPRSVTPLQVVPPLQVLVAVSAPANLATLDVDAEVRRVRASLADLERSGQVRLTILESATLAELRRALRRGTYHVLHFIGHGGFNSATHEGMLAFEDEHRMAHLVSGTDLATMIHDHRTLRLVLLNACEGARQSPADPLGGVAQSLVMQGIPAVVAMQFEITDAAATIFSTEFYSAIADGYPIDAALAEARVAVFSSHNDVEWGTPVLYLRASDGRIFDVAPVPAGTEPGPVPAAASPPASPVGPASPVVPEPTPAFFSSDPNAPTLVMPVQPETRYDSGAGFDPAGAGPGRPFDPGPPPPIEPTRPAFLGEPEPRRRRRLLGPLLGVLAALVALVVLFLNPQLIGLGTSTTGQPSVTPSGEPSESETPSAPPSSRPPSSRPPTTPAMPPIQAKDPLLVDRVNHAMTIDGNTDDWQWQYVARADKRVAGTSTATGDIYLMWDDQALYLLAVVTDGTLRAPDPGRPSQVYRGDGIMLELGPDKRGLKDRDVARPHDGYYMFGLPTGAQQAKGILRYDPKRRSFETPQGTSELQVAVTTSATGYTLEARIPWTTTGLTGVRAGAVFAGNVLVTEREAGRLNNLGMRSTNPQRTLQLRIHPAYWHDVELRG